MHRQIFLPFDQWLQIIRFVPIYRKRSSRDWTFRNSSEQVCRYLWEIELEEDKNLLLKQLNIVSIRMIGGYFFNSLINLSFVVEDELYAFVLVINESEKYDQFIQPTSIT